MKRIFLILVVVCALHTNVSAQESTTYFFMGNIYGGDKQYAYLPVYLSYGENPEKIIAVSMSNGQGVISFFGVPIDEHKDYVFTIPFPKGSQQYIYRGLSQGEEFSFASGNISIHMKIEDEMLDYVTIEEKYVEKEDEERSIKDWLLSQFPTIELDDNTFVDKKTQKSLRLLLNGMPMPEEQIVPILNEGKMNMVKKVVLAKLKEPNDYIAGAIEIVIPIAPVQEYVKTTYSLQRIK